MRKFLITCAAVAFASAAAPALAAPLSGTFYFTVETGETNGAGFQAVQGAAPFTGATAKATFGYTGTLNFSLTQSQNSTNAGDLNSAFFATATNGGAGANYGITSYSGTGTFAQANADFTTLAGFLASSASASSYNWGSLYTINLGSIASGTVLTIAHDDGVSVFQNGVRLSTTTAGPTVAITEQVTTSGTIETILYYGRQNGSPSVLTVSVPEGVNPFSVPEPMSLALFGIALAGLGFAARGRRKA